LGVRVTTADSSYRRDDTICRLYNNIIPPSHLPPKANYYLFKVGRTTQGVECKKLTGLLQDGIIPAWEDEANKIGGKWSIQLPKDKNRSNVDRMWLYTVCMFRIAFE
jgi:translation initiation factor 4E